MEKIDLEKIEELFTEPRPLPRHKNAFYGKPSLAKLVSTLNHICCTGMDNFGEKEMKTKRPVTKNT